MVMDILPSRFVGLMVIDILPAGLLAKWSWTYCPQVCWLNGHGHIARRFVGLMVIDILPSKSSDPVPAPENKCN